MRRSIDCQTGEIHCFHTDAMRLDLRVYMKQRINLYLDENLVERAKIQAVLLKTSVSEMVEALLQEHVDRLEMRKVQAKS